MSNKIFDEQVLVLAGSFPAELQEREDIPYHPEQQREFLPQSSYLLNIERTYPGKLQHLVASYFLRRHGFFEVELIGYHSWVAWLSTSPHPKQLDRLNMILCKGEEAPCIRNQTLSSVHPYEEFFLDNLSFAHLLICKPFLFTKRI